MRPVGSTDLSEGTRLHRLVTFEEQEALASDLAILIILFFVAAWLCARCGTNAPGVIWSIAMMIWCVRFLAAA